MSRRIRPPMHPVTGHPYVDNELRNAWRECRDDMRSRPANVIVFTVDGSFVWRWNHLPKARKPRKRLRRDAYAVALSFYPKEWYAMKKQPSKGNPLK